jgi:phosphatidylserine/phosphatidylglycerophosphate/cardiolipin synthase-like enzyme
VNGRSALGVALAILLVALFVGAILLFVRGRPDAPAGPEAGEPRAGDWYRVYFTEPRYPDGAETRRGGIDERFVEFVDSAARTLDVAVYDFDLENAARALARARSRGVAVRMVLDSDTIENTREPEVQHALAIVREGGVPLIGDERQGIMHHKFAVRDGEEVWTGSWNMTVGDTYRLNNNAVRLRSAELATHFSTEFEEMFVQGRFGPSKPRTGPPPPIQIGPAWVQALFSPGEGVARRIAERVSEAQSEINFMAFSFTHDLIGRAAIDRARAGVQVAGVFETTGSQTRFSEYTTMKQAGLMVYQDGKRSATQWDDHATLDRPGRSDGRLSLSPGGGAGCA